jgi:hypothetical protein
MAILVNAGAGVGVDSIATLSNKTLEAPVINDATFTGQQSGLQIAFNDAIVFEGTTADASELTLSAGEPTADRTVTLPNATTTLVGRDTTDTLTNKTLTSPVITGAIFNDGSVVFEGATANDFETTLAITDPTADRTITFPDSTGTVALTSDITVTASSTNTFTNKSISLATNTVTATLAELNTAISDADVASLAGSETLTNKTLTSPVINTATFKDGVVRGLEEDVNVVASAATGTINLDVDTASIWYYTSNATANHTLNIRYSSGVTLNTALAVGDAITVVWMNTNGSTAYYPNVIQVDGSAVTPKVPSAITGGNASAIDVYSFTIIKTASATFTVLESQTKFA